MTIVRSSDRAIVLLGLAAVLSPHLLVALGCAFAAGGVVLVGRATSPVMRIALAIALAGLGTATWLAATIVGPLPATYAALRDGPIGDPAARLLMLFLLAPGTIFLLDRSLIPAGIALVARVGPDALPAGITLWQGIAMPVALTVAVAAVVRRRADLLALAVGAFALWSGSLPGRIGGAAVLGGRMLGGDRAGVPPAGQGDIARLLTVAGALLGLAGSIRVQFVYTVCLAILLLLVLARRPLGGDARTQGRTDE